MSDDEDDSSPATETQPLPYSPNTPYIAHMNEGSAVCPNYTPVFDEELEKFGAYFSLPSEADPTPDSLCEIFFPDSMLETWLKATTEYAASRLPVSRRVKVTKAHLCWFIAMIYYTGIVKLPSKDDYFQVEKDDDFWPFHPAIHLSYRMFCFATFI